MKNSLENILSLSALEAAPLLLGWKISRQTPAGLLSLTIVETEAYHQDDPASHSYAGVTSRTAPMFEEGGRLYVYFTYGMHYCLNIVVGQKGVGEAVLLRAGEPLMGIEVMKKNRKTENIYNLANGPGKLAQALGINDTLLSGKILNKSSIFLQPPHAATEAADIIVTPRVGIKKAVDNPWRFYIKKSIYVSHPRIKKGL